MITLDNCWIVITECKQCGELIEISELKYVEAEFEPLCEFCDIDEV